MIRWDSKIACERDLGNKKQMNNSTTLLKYIFIGIHLINGISLSVVYFTP